MAEIGKAEAHIISKRYHKMAKVENPPTVNVAATNLEAIIAMNPQRKAEELNTLNEKVKI